MKYNKQIFSLRFWKGEGKPPTKSDLQRKKEKINERGELLYKENLVQGKLFLFFFAFTDDLLVFYFQKSIRTLGMLSGSPLLNWKMILQIKKTNQSLTKNNCVLRVKMENLLVHVVSM